MATGALNKAALAKAERDLATYRRFLPALDLKRQQLMAEREKARDALASLRASEASLAAEAGARLPMLADRSVDIAGLVALEGVEVGEENVVGTRLPVLKDARVRVLPYSPFARPHWVDAAAEAVSEAVVLKVRVRIAEERLARLEEAVRTVTQRVNLFDKVLIPRTEAEIRRIRVFLGDAEKAAVVRSKIAKRKHAAAAAGEGAR